MWYLAWVLGVTMAVLLAVVNVVWYEAEEVAAADGGNFPASDEPGGSASGDKDGR